MTALNNYLSNRFLTSISENNHLPFTNDPHISLWEEYFKETIEKGTLSPLKNGLRQLNFPIEKGISDTETYKSVTRRGSDPNGCDEATGIKLNKENEIKLFMHQSAAGKVPVILISDREDFESFIRAITCRNEPKPLPRSMGASMIAGYNNWDRIDRYKNKWLLSKNKEYMTWGEEFLNNVMPNHSLYKDRFILLSKGPYSNVPASDLGLNDDEWIEHSITIRLEHECNHYFTKRFFGSMQNNMHDELLADYMGITAALGYFDPNWFLHFIGLEGPKYREGARLQNYLGDPPLEETDIETLQSIMRKATEQVYLFDKQLGQNTSQKERTFRMLAISQLRLDELSQKGSKEMILNKYGHLKKNIIWK